MAAPRTALRAQPGASTTVIQTPTQEGSTTPRLVLPQAGTLRLRATPSEDRHIQWAEDVVDNEGMGKKSSKVCCIYHKPRAPGDSSDEDTSDSDPSDSDSEPDTSRAMPAGGRGRGSHRHHHGHEHDKENGGGDSAPKSKDKGKDSARKPSPNAYEKMPRYTKK